MQHLKQGSSRVGIRERSQDHGRYLVWRSRAKSTRVSPGLVCLRWKAVRVNNDGSASRRGMRKSVWLPRSQSLGLGYKDGVQFRRQHRRLACPKGQGVHPLRRSPNARAFLCLHPPRRLSLISLRLAEILFCPWCCGSARLYFVPDRRGESWLGYQRHNRWMVEDFTFFDGSFM